MRKAPPPGTASTRLSCLSQLPPEERKASLEIVMGRVTTYLPALLDPTGAAGMVGRVCFTMEKNLARSRMSLPVRERREGCGGG